jgi:hypothetical protein
MKQAIAGAVRCSEVKRAGRPLPRVAEPIRRLVGLMLVICGGASSVV